jgi:hypothetical protein
MRQTRILDAKKISKKGIVTGGANTNQLPRTTVKGQGLITIKSNLESPSG